MKAFINNLANMRWSFSVIFFILAAITAGDIDYADTTGGDYNWVTLIITVLFGLLSVVSFVAKEVRDHE